jgi:hypothetical protein
MVNELAYGLALLRRQVAVAIQRRDTDELDSVLGTNETHFEVPRILD